MDVVGYVPLYDLKTGTLTEALAPVLGLRTVERQAISPDEMLALYLRILADELQDSDTGLIVQLISLLKQKIAGDDAAEFPGY